MDQTPKIEGARGVLVWAGLGNPGARGLLGAVAIGSLAENPGATPVATLLGQSERPLEILWAP